MGRLVIKSRTNPEHVYLLNHHKYPKVYKYNFVKNKFLNFRRNKNGKRRQVLTKRTRFETVFGRFMGDKKLKLKLKETKNFDSVFFDENGGLVILTESDEFSLESSTLKIASTE